MAGTSQRTRPLVAVRFRDAPDTVRLPLDRLEQQANGAWCAVIVLPRWADDGDAVMPWDETMRVPPGQYEQVPGQDYRGIKRVRHPLLMH